MIRFEYDNNEADNLILEFKCKSCHALSKTELLNVPQLDINTLGKTKLSYQHKCMCGDIYSIDIYNGIFDYYGIVNGIDGNESDVCVHEVSKYFYNKDSILIDTIGSYSKIESIIEGINEMSNDNKSYVYCLLFSNLISILDAFIKIYTEPIILGDNNLIEKFTTAFQMPKGDIEYKIQKIKNFFNLNSFQSLSNQKKLFVDVFNIKIEIDERIEHYVSIRNVIVHRNAIDPEGFLHKINKNQLLQALDVIKKYIRQIHSVLLDYEADMFADKIINREYK